MAEERIDLRTYIFLDSLQYQMASLMATTSRGYYPVALQACMIIEISPGIEINRFTDIALKATNVTPGIQFVERLFGLLEVHSDSQADARQAGAAILGVFDVRPEIPQRCEQGGTRRRRCHVEVDAAASDQRQRLC